MAARFGVQLTAALPLLAGVLAAAVLLAQSSPVPHNAGRMLAAVEAHVDRSQLMLVVAAPAVTMFAGSLSVLGSRLPEMLQACCQNFSAGLLLSAVAGELYPMLSDPPGNQAVDAGRKIAGLCGGFALGLAFMLGLDHLTHGMEGDDDAEEAAGDAESPKHSLTAPFLQTGEDPEVFAEVKAEAKQLNANVGNLELALMDGTTRDSVDEVLHGLMLQVHKIQRRLDNRGPLDGANRGRMLCHTRELREHGEDLVGQTTVAGVRKSLRNFDDALEHIHGHAERGRFQRWKPVPKPVSGELTENLPWPLVAAVTIDAAVDGLLIGLSYSASAGAGFAMSIATCIEMGFLGLSFSASVQNVTRSRGKLFGLAMVPPLVLIFAGFLGASLGVVSQEGPALFIGFISFAVVALLFLVTQELLAEAQEYDRGNSVVTSLFFVGLLAGILLGYLID